MSYEVKASAAVLKTLRDSVVDDAGVTLPGQLERGDYVEVNKFLELAGAAWNRKAKRHLFISGIAKDKIKALLSTGEITNEKKKFQAFYTPDDLADEVVKRAGIKPKMVCLEPSAGDGQLVSRMAKAGGIIRAIELNPEAAGLIPGNVQGEANIGIDTMDFLELKQVSGIPAFDRIVMNPPFTKDQDVKHVMHALQFLKPGGKLVAIMSPAWRTKANKACEALRAELGHYNYKIDHVPAGTFKDSGTNIATIILEVERPK